MEKKKITRSSEELRKVISELEIEMKELRHIQEDVTNKLRTYLNSKQPDEFTRSFFQGKLAPNAVNVQSNRLIELSIKYDEAKEEYINALRTELIQGFITQHPELKTQLKECEIKKSEMGDKAMVRIK